MKIINNNRPLMIKGIKNLDDTELTVIDKDVILARVNDKDYMVVNRKFKNSPKTDEKIIDLKDATCTICDRHEKDLKLNTDYGDKDSFIVDMHGIDNFMLARELVFCDSTVRKIVLKLCLTGAADVYYRFGCAGARECSYHPGGEVYESMLIKGSDLSGISQSVSGYLPEGEEYSRSVPLHSQNDRFLRDERIVYSHTAFLRGCKKEEETSIYVKINAKRENVSFLDILTELATHIDLSCYAIQICIENDDKSNFDTKVKGRVLRHMPTSAFKVLQEATDIGLEQVFNIQDGDTMYAVGTNYKRYEPEWKVFTSGRQYERRGHIHATVVRGQKSKTKLHEVFHLRDAFISPASKVQVVLTPIENVFKIYPIYKEDNKYYCSTTDKEISEVIQGIRNFDISIKNQ